MRKILLYIFLFCSCSLYGQNTIVAKDFFSLMHGVDKLHAPYHKKRQRYKYRNEHRQKHIAPEIADSFFNSDTLYVMICPDSKGEYVDGFEERLYSDKLYFRIPMLSENDETNLEWENFLRKEMDYIIQGKYEVTANASDLWKHGYDLYYFIRLIRTKENEFSYKKETFHIYHLDNDIRILKKI